MPQTFTGVRVLNIENVVFVLINVLFKRIKCLLALNRLGPDLCPVAGNFRRHAKQLESQWMMGNYKLDTPPS